MATSLQFSAETMNRSLSYISDQNLDSKRIGAGPLRPTDGVKVQLCDAQHTVLSAQ
jgi:hypothetical protein